MTTGNIERRHSRWYEIILLNPIFQIIAGLIFVVFLPAWWFWGHDFWNHLNNVRSSTIIANTASLISIVFIMRRLSKYSSGGILAQIIPVVTVIFLIAFATVFFTRGAYSRPVLLSSYVLCLLWCFAGYFLGRRYRRLKFALLPTDNKFEFKSTTNLEIRKINKPDLEGIRYDAIIADLRSASMTPEWERFLAKCILAQMPVYNIHQVIEGYTGQVEIDHLSENEVGALLPSPVYTVFKRFIDIVGVLVLLPVLLPIMLLTAIAIKIDSVGPALFIQNRVGLGNRDFKIYKFRSMFIDIKGSSFTDEEDDPRITRVGKVIRKYRIDELPQVLNIIRGEMSFIGPRPESKKLAEWYEQEVPFFTYRHIVRPGITGWAQVTQGYAAEIEGMREKLKYDFYYIKNFSLWLDILITFKTIKILITGWGAR